LLLGRRLGGSALKQVLQPVALALKRGHRCLGCRVLTARDKVGRVASRQLCVLLLLLLQLGGLLDGLRFEREQLLA